MSTPFVSLNLLVNVLLDTELAVVDLVNDVFNVVHGTFAFDETSLIFV